MKSAYMEELFVYALLYCEGFDVWVMYSETLDRLFVENLDNEEYLYGELLSLEGMAPKDAVLHTLSIMDRNQFDFDAECFGKLLMRTLQQIYKDSTIQIFAERMYSLWNKLPGSISGEEPFYTFCYADDCLSYGDEGQCRHLYEMALHYYE